MPKLCLRLSSRLGLNPESGQGTYPTPKPTPVADRPAALGRAPYAYQ